MIKKLSFLIVILITFIKAEDIPNVVLQNGCMDCHNVMGKKSAPAFMGIARKNKTQFSDTAREKIESSIKNGSSGAYRQFSDQVMPSYEHFTPDELNEISEWIFSLEMPNKRADGMGQKNMGNF
ncbi:MAG: cytochrome c [Campylobacterales bacterium]|nr:cytochrome c [Campylobacterales bacterium]